MGALVRQAGIAPDSVGLIAVHDHRAIAAVKAADTPTALPPQPVYARLQPHPS